MPALVAENLSAGYSRVPVINGVTVTAERGQITTIVGPNGAGKSTFAKTLSGVLRPIDGTVTVAGVDITGIAGHLIPRRGLAYVPQNDNVFATLTVRENLEVAGFASPGRPEKHMARVFDVFPDLAKADGKKAGQLSGGQQNLLAIARALMVDPKVIVLDEPTAGLSPAYTNVVWDLIRTIASTEVAALVVEQNVDRALARSDVVYILVAGRNYTSGPAEQIAQLNLGDIFLGKGDEDGAAFQSETRRQGV